MNELTKSYQDYIRRTEEIRKLSTPSFDNINDVEMFTEKFRENFTRIGELAALNREFLGTIFFPKIDSDSVLKTEDVKELGAFSRELIREENAENLDLPIASLIEERLAMEAGRRKDFNEKIHRMDAQMGICYELMNMTGRIRVYPDIAEHYRERGFALGRLFMKYLEKDFFETIDDPRCRAIILTNVRYSIAFFDGLEADRADNREQLRLLEWMLQIEEDPFYRKMLPDYDWKYHHFRVLQYYTVTTDRNNEAGFDSEQLELISERSAQCMDFWDSHEDYLKKEMGSDEDRVAEALSYHRNLYLAGKMDKNDFKSWLMKEYEKRNAGDYGFGGCYANLCIPLEMIRLVDRSNLREADKSMLQQIYRDVLGYIFHMPNGGSLSYVMGYFTQLLDEYIETPSGLSFEGMLLFSIAALHPPTAVHSLMVGRITECLCSHLIRLDPGRLVGVMGCADASQVTARKKEILTFVYHGALCHDCGKISIIDTIFIYGRRLLDMEFDLIKTHPMTGSAILERHTSTRAFAPIARGHHRWYDNSRGYPEEFNTAQSSLKPVIDLVCCADCLDAATDIIGRSYNKGKTLDDFILELREGSGSHYAPWLIGLFEDAEVREDLEYLLLQGRQQTYRNLYYQLREIHER